jgi:hypothetical protein
MFAFEPLFSSAPPSIHLLRISSFAGASLSCIGGISGFSLWLAKAHKRLLSRSPASTTSPELPPSIVFA